MKHPSLVSLTAFAALAASFGCGTITETEYEGFEPEGSAVVQYDADGNSTVVEKRVDSMMPYGGDDAGIRRAEDFGLMEAPPE